MLNDAYKNCDLHRSETIKFMKTFCRILIAGLGISSGSRWVS